MFARLGRLIRAEHRAPQSRFATPAPVFHPHNCRRYLFPSSLRKQKVMASVWHWPTESLLSTAAYSRLQMQSKAGQSSPSGYLRNHCDGMVSNTISGGTRKRMGQCYADACRYKQMMPFRKYDRQHGARQPHGSIVANNRQVNVFHAHLPAISARSRAGEENVDCEWRMMVDPVEPCRRSLNALRLVQRSASPTPERTVSPFDFRNLMSTCMPFYSEGGANFFRRCTTRGLPSTSKRRGHANSKHQALGAPLDRRASAPGHVIARNTSIGIQLIRASDNLP